MEKLEVAAVATARVQFGTHKKVVERAGARAFDATADARPQIQPRGGGHCVEIGHALSKGDALRDGMATHHQRAKVIGKRGEPEEPEPIEKQQRSERSKPSELPVILHQSRRSTQTPQALKYAAATHPVFEPSAVSKGYTETPSIH